MKRSTLSHLTSLTLLLASLASVRAVEPIPAFKPGTRVPLFTYDPDSDLGWHVYGHATVRRDGIEGKGGQWSMEEEEAFRAPIRRQYEEQGHPYFATSRLWDDGIITPSETRRVIGLSLSACLNAPIEDPKFGVFRM